MTSNRIFLFPIQTASLSFGFRLLEIQISPPLDGTFKAKLLNRVKSKFARRIWKSEKNKAAEKWSVLTKINKKHLLAVPAELNPTDSKIEFPKMNRTVYLQDTMKTYHFSFDEPMPEYEDIAFGWLNDNLRIILERHSSELWNLGMGYFNRAPINAKDNKRTIDLFLGFSLRIYRHHKGYALCVSDRVKYVDAHSLQWHISKGNPIRGDLPKNGIYKNGPDWYAIKILDKTGVSIRDQMIPGLNQTVYQYVRENSRLKTYLKDNKLDPESPAFEYQYPNDTATKHFANSAWGHFTFGPSDPIVKPLHKYSIMEPSERFENVHRFVRRFLANNRNLPISPDCEATPCKRFPVPSLIYGGNHTLRIGKSEDGSNIHIANWFKLKKKLLLDHGICKKGGALLPQHLVVSDSMDPYILRTFSENLKEKIGQLTGRAYDFCSIHTFSIPSGTPSLSRYFEAINKTFDQNRLLEDKDATIVLVLPPKSPPKLHDHLKMMMKDGIRSQFLVESYLNEGGKLGICDFFERDSLSKGKSFRIKKGFENRFNSYVFNIALGILMVNRKWLYRLEKPLHADIIIGLDVSNRKVGMSLYDGKSGEIIFTFDFTGKFVKDARYRREKLPVKIMEKLTYKFLKEGIAKLQLCPKSIVVHRDGRAFDSEWSGLKKAVKRLQNEKTLSNNLGLGIVEIYKSSVSMPRIVASIGSTIKNPGIGSYEDINSMEGVLINTGFPAEHKGTANPLFIRVGHGNIDLNRALHDVFDLSNLCYAAPDKPQRLPITLKIIDDFLTPLAYDIESPGFDTEEDEESALDTDVVSINRAMGGR